MHFSPELVFIVVLDASVIIGNIMVLIILFKTETFNNVNRYYLCSLTLADLGIGVLVLPLSIVSSAADRWMFNTHVCRFEAYIAAIFWIASLYSLAWLSIDRYIAIRKPERYQSLMTNMKCICWCMFLWTAAVSFCAPPLFGVGKAKYYKPAYICIVDWRLQEAYLITSGLLIVIPPTLAVAISNTYLIRKYFSENGKDYFQSIAALGGNAPIQPENGQKPPVRYLVSTIVCLMFVITWAPWCLLQIVEMLLMAFGHPVNHANTWIRYVHFTFTWLALSNSLLKFVIYACLDAHFRCSLANMFRKRKTRGVDV